MNKPEWEEQKRKEREQQRRWKELKEIVDRYDPCKNMDGGVHTVGWSASAETGEFYITLGVRQRTERFNRQLGEFREIVALHMDCSDKKGLVRVTFEGPPPKPWDPDRR